MQSLANYRTQARNFVMAINRLKQEVSDKQSWLNSIPSHIKKSEMDYVVEIEKEIREANGILNNLDTINLLSL